MPASGKQAIQHYRSTTAGTRPSALSAGEILLQMADGGLAWSTATGGVAYMPIPIYLNLANDYTNATTTLSNLFQFSGVAGAVYEVDIYAIWQGSATTVSLKAALTASSTTTTQTMRLDVSPSNTGTASPTFLSLGVSGTAQTGPAPTAATTSAPAIGRGVVAIGGTAGTVTLQMAASASGTLTIKAGSFMKYRRIA